MSPDVSGFHVASINCARIDDGIRPKNGGANLKVLLTKILIRSRFVSLSHTSTQPGNTGNRCRKELRLAFEENFMDDPIACEKKQPFGPNRRLHSGSTY